MTFHLNSGVGFLHGSARRGGVWPSLWSSFDRPVLLYPPTLSSLHVQNVGVRNTDAPFDPLLPGCLALHDIIDLAPLH